MSNDDPKPPVNPKIILSSGSQPVSPPDLPPTKIDNKVAAAGIAGAITIILVWLIRTTTGIDVPPEVASSITAVLSFIAGYMTPRSTIN